MSDEKRSTNRQGIVIMVSDDPSLTSAMRRLVELSKSDDSSVTILRDRFEELEKLKLKALDELLAAPLLVPIVPSRSNLNPSYRGRRKKRR